MAIRTEDHSDLSKFGNRLWALMSSKGYSAPRALAKALYNENLVSVNTKENDYTTFEEEEKNAIGSVEKKIVRHLRAEDAKKVQGEFITAYCKHFNCSADYLFGFTEIQSGNPDIRNACRITGLSEKAVTQLSETLVEEDGEASPIQKCWSRILDSELFTELPFDWTSARQEAEECIKCEADVAAISEVLKQADPSLVSCQLIAMKEKPIDKAGKGHYAAYYGMLHKIAQDIIAVLDSLVEEQTKKDNIYENAYKQMKWQIETQICSDTGETPPPRPDGEFRWNEHILI